MFERDHPEPLSYQKGYGAGAGPPLAALPRHRHLSRARRHHHRPRPAAARCSTAPTRCPGRASCSSPSPPCRSRRSTCSAPSGTSYFGPPALPYVPGVQAVGVVRDGPADARSGAGCGSRRRPGMAPGDGGLAELAVARAAEAVVVEADLPDTTVAALGLSAVAAWEVLEGARRAARRRDGARARRRRRRRPGRGAGGPPARCRPRRRGRPLDGAHCAGRPSLRRGCRGRPARRRGRRLRSAQRLRDACGGSADVVVDPLAGIPGTCRGAGARRGRAAGQPRQHRRRRPSSVDSATLRSRSAAVLGYTNTALTDARRRSVFATVLGHAAAGRLEVTHDVVPLDGAPAAWAEVAAGRAPRAGGRHPVTGRPPAAPATSTRPASTTGRPRRARAGRAAARTGRRRSRARMPRCR